MKKKVFLLLTFIVLALGILFSGSKPEVEAAESCENYTIYYLLLDATKAVTFVNTYKKPTTLGEETTYFRYYDSPYNYWVYSTDKLFNAVPKSGAKNIKKEIVKLGETASSGSGVEMTYAKFLEWFNKIGDNVEYDAGNNVTYIRAIPWVRNDASEKEEEDIQTSSYNMKDVSEETFVNNIPTNYGSPEIIVRNQDSSHIVLTINRNWAYDDRLKKYDNTTDKSVVIFSPAVYKITYEVCEKVDDPVDTKTVHVNFCELGDRECGNSTNLADRITLGEFEIGDNKPLYTCPDPLSNYPTSSKIKVSDPENYKFDSDDGNDGGVIKEDKDNDIWCYYTKETTETPTKHTLTVKYGTTEDCSNLITIWKSEDLETGTKKIVDAGNTFEISGSKFTYSGVGNKTPKNFTNYTRSNEKLTVTMPDSDVTICLVYTPKTGLSKGWLYLVWAIGLGSLGYSGWYFYRYYKNKKQEI